MIHVHVMKTYGDSTAPPRHFRPRFNGKGHSFVSHARWYVQIDSSKRHLWQDANWKMSREIRHKRNKSTHGPVVLLKNFKPRLRSCPVTWRAIFNYVEITSVRPSLPTGLAEQRSWTRIHNGRLMARTQIAVGYPRSIWIAVHSRDVRTPFNFRERACTAGN